MGEPPDSGETNGGMSDRARSFEVPSVDSMDCLSARRPIAGTACGAVPKPLVRPGISLAGGSEYRGNPEQHG
jgi:hypothetical protein